MKLPYLNVPEQTRIMTDQFLGYNHNLTISDGEWYDTINATARFAPVAANRGKRHKKQYGKKILGMVGRGDGLCYILASDNLTGVDAAAPKLHYNGQDYDIGLSENNDERTMVGMGAYIAVYPDGCYFNTADPTEKGRFKAQHINLNYKGAILTYSVCVKNDSGDFVEVKSSYDGSYLPGKSTIYERSRVTGKKGTTEKAGEKLLSYGYASEIKKLGNDDAVEWRIDNANPAGCATVNASTGEIEFVQEGTATLTYARYVTENGQTNSYAKQYFEIVIYDGTTSTISSTYRIFNGTLYSGNNEVQAYLLVSKEEDLTITQDSGIVDFQVGEDGPAFEFLKNLNSAKVQLVKCENYKDSSDVHHSRYYFKVDKCPEIPYISCPGQTLTVRPSDLKEAMSCYCEHNNRIWGAIRGKKSGVFVNEISASELGGFSFSNFEETDGGSYSATVGTDGNFTACISYGGYPFFFKENVIYKVYGDYPSNYEVLKIDAPGVEEGSEKSLCAVGGLLYYKGKNGVYSFDGSTFSLISNDFGGVRYTNAVAGSAEDRFYYISMKDSAGSWHLFCYDTRTGLWMREDNTRFTGTAQCAGSLYGWNNEGKAGEVCCIGSPSETGYTEEKDFRTVLESGNIGYSMPDNKYISRFNLRLSVSLGAQVDVWIMYDSDGNWINKGRVSGTGVVRSVTFPIVPRRCDHMKFRIEGQGNFRLYSIAKILEQGSDE